MRGETRSSSRRASTGRPRGSWGGPDPRPPGPAATPGPRWRGRRGPSWGARPGSPAWSGATAPPWPSPTARAHSQSSRGPHPSLNALFGATLRRLAGEEGAQAVVVPRTERQRAEALALGADNIVVPEREIDAQRLIAFADLVGRAGG